MAGMRRMVRLAMFFHIAVFNKMKKRFVKKKMKSMNLTLILDNFVEISADVPELVIIDDNIDR